MRLRPMRNRLLVPCAILALCAASPSPQSGAPIAATACSNPQLPPAILNGQAPYQTGKSLPLVAVSAPARALTLAVAATGPARELGLMCVTALVPQRGMIFVFANSSFQEFWMKRTLVPLDMVWVAADGRVTNVAANVPASSMDTPDDAVARRNGQGRYVIELRGGEAALDGIRSGAKLVIPALRAAD